MGQENVPSQELVLLVERMERLEEEKKGIMDDMKDVLLEAKAKGYDVKTIREVLKLRKLEPQVVREQRALIDTYMAAFGVEFE